uniref:NADH-ubiquinone oxidoreductase chain 4 n=1 Tax=Cardioglossa leucomystax TaxID=111122 RepID=S4V1K6_9NEOB|nr:NADH dehydrogenase subunit 4 [Cardioglossa leucomystax]
MLIITSAWLSMFITNSFFPKKHLWTATLIQSFTIAMLSFMLFLPSLCSPSLLTSIDNISGPLAILTCWLFPLALIASQSKISKEPITRQRLYINNATALQIITLLAFSASDIMLFFIFFEASLIPTLIIITRWGAQERRLEAGMYLAFYTMFGATPLIIFIMNLYSKLGTLSPALIQNFIFIQPQTPHLLFWTICNLAFLVKLPMYCLHLWLPKAHVEAPIAGSMILAGTLLKLGGYGILRCSILLPGISSDYIMPFLSISLLGVIATAALCLRQTDLKSLIAMSSVSHMNLVIAAAIIQSPNSFAGAMIMMISHGLTSSALFCLANTAYERTNSRTMILLRGALIMMPLLGISWISVLLFNLALPPSISFLAELMIFSSMFSWSTEMFLISSPILLLTAAYTLFILWSIQRGPTPSHLKTLFPTTVREQILLTLHIMPALLFITKPEILF